MVRKNRSAGRGKKARPNTDGTRMCIGCRQRAPREELARLVADSDGRVFYDRYRKAPGRGAHLCYRAACVDNMIQSRAMGRALKRAVTVDDADALKRAMLTGIEARIDDGLRIGSQAGWIISGTDVILRNARRVCLLILAADVAEDTVRRLRTALGRDVVPWVCYGLASDLGKTQGREARVALGVVDSSWAKRLRNEFDRRDGVLVVQSAESR
jgi:hypothetical protein